MSTPRKIKVFDNNEAESIITQRNDIAADTSIKNIFGIDLGTTNSAISIVKGGKSQIITLSNGKNTIPSCVMWTNGEFIIGDEAYKNKGLPNVQYSVKRLMEDAFAKVTFKDGDNQIEMTPTEVSAEILKGIVRAAGDMYGIIHDVVVTVPAYFNDIGKRNTMKACELAGLNLIALENEPSAAALEYELPANKMSEDVLIYDLGGGTFDITLARITKMQPAEDAFAAYGFDNASVGKASKIIRPLALGGNGKLGGDDIDNELFNIVMHKLGIRPENVPERATKEFTAKLEQFKKCGVESVYSTDFNYTLLDGTEVNVDAIITPDDFVASVEPIYKKTKREINRVLKETANTASKILLVGGSTKNPIIREKLRNDYSSFEISATLHPDEVVSLGAATKGRILKYGDASIASFDILPITIGILDGSDNIVPVIKKNTELPVSASSPFTTEQDNQTSMRVVIYQGNSTFREDCVCLGELMITGIPKKKAGEPRLYVNLTITANNVLICEAVVEGIKKTLQLSLNNEESAPKEHVMAREEKCLVRWRNLAKKLDGSKKDEFINLLDGYPSTVSADTIRDYIKTNLSER